MYASLKKNSLLKTAVMNNFSNALHTEQDKKNCQATSSVFRERSYHLKQFLFNDLPNFCGTLADTSQHSSHLDTPVGNHSFKMYKYLDGVYTTYGSNYCVMMEYLVEDSEVLSTTIPLFYLPLGT